MRVWNLGRYLLDRDGPRPSVHVRQSMSCDRSPEPWAAAPWSCVLGMDRLPHKGGKGSASPAGMTGDRTAPVIDAVLVGLRLESLVEALDRTGAVRRCQVDDAFLRLIAERFVPEARPPSATRAPSGWSRSCAKGNGRRVAGRRERVNSRHPPPATRYPRRRPLVSLPVTVRVIARIFA